MGPVINYFSQAQDSALHAAQQFHNYHVAWLLAAGTSSLCIPGCKQGLLRGYFSSPTAAKRNPGLLAHKTFEIPGYAAAAPGLQNYEPRNNP